MVTYIFEKTKGETKDDHKNQNNKMVFPIYIPKRDPTDLQLLKKDLINMVPQTDHNTAQRLVRQTPRGVTIPVYVGLISLIALGAAQAQVPAQCSNTDKLGATQLRVTQQSARALVEITRPNSAGRKVEIEYGEESYVGKFDKDGRARMGFALTEPKAEFAIRIAETPVVNCKVDVPDFAKIFRVTLRWRDPVQLDFHVIEPGRRMNDFGHVSPARPNTNFAQGIGQMDVISGAPTDGATAEASYAVPDGGTIPADSVFGYRVDYVTRGMKPEAPYCDEHPLAAPLMELIILDKGKVTNRKLGTNHARCNEAIPEARRFMVLR